MPSVREHLIELYANRTAEDAENTAEFAGLCQKHGTQTPFKETQLKLKTMRQELAQLLDDQQTYRAQVKLSLDQLRLVRTDEADREIYESFIRGSYYEPWNDDQKGHFNWACDVIAGEVDYFLSFTSRRLDPKEKVNPVNDAYFRFIETVIRDKDIVKELDLSRNLVAAAVNRYMGRRLKGFYYPDHEEDNTVVVNKLEENSKKAVTFVQLIQGVMFVEDVDNYCRLEYLLAKADPHRRLFFVFLDRRDDLLMRRPATKDNREWFEHVAQDVDAVHLVPTDDDDSEAVKTNKDKIRDKVIEPILNAINDLFENVPND